MRNSFGERWADRVCLTIDWRKLRGGIAALCIVSSGLVGCGGDTTGPAPLAADQAYWALQLNYHAVNLALTSPYNTLQLHATPVNAFGKVLMNTGPVHYIVDDSLVSVDSTGQVTAHYRTRSIASPARIVASLQYQGVTLTDTVLVQVTDTAPTAQLATFQLHPATGGSTVCNVNTTKLQLLENCGSVVVTATNENGDTVVSARKRNSILIMYRSSNPLLATVDATGKIVESDTGHVIFVASTWAYGIAMRDSLAYVINWPRFQVMPLKQITPVNSLTPIITFPISPITVGVGGTVAWTNPYEQKVDIVFDDSLSVDSGCYYLQCNFPITGSGNVPPFYKKSSTSTDTSVFALGLAVRSFPKAGTYYYHSRLFPTSKGVIYVREDIPQ